VVLNSNQQTDKYSSATFPHDAGVAVHIVSEHAIAHDDLD